MPDCFSGEDQASALSAEATPDGNPGVIAARVRVGRLRGGPSRAMDRRLTSPREGPEVEGRHASNVLAMEPSPASPLGYDLREI